ncbi:helix-turn-helix domain-containing protein [Acidimicrobiaceae bacterium USS-CC1]|uniref:Helix-turn-helix domain-containing protein n=1 Tax=Acidiferrimicrobium australe TaxID=2664430 RepID=A0ABW9QPT5_9ACTN|nr:helix-turn-helix domain-containing protein [Acidiferrimicrobium australe]
MSELRDVLWFRGLCRAGTARAVRQVGCVGLGEAARAAGVAKSSVSRWERGLQQPRGEAAVRYARWLHSQVALVSEGESL